MKKEIEINGSKFKMVVNKEYKVMGKYRGVEDKLCDLVGNSKRCSFVDGVNGDGSGEFYFWEGIDKIVKRGVEVGLWKVNRNKLNVIDDENWNKFFEVVVW